MSVIVVLADPPRAGLVLSELSATTALSPADAAALYGATLKDTCRAAEQSGGELLVNYRPEDLLPEQHITETNPEADLRALVGEAVEDLSTVRFEPQVGSTVSARVGNTVTHLLRDEDATSVGFVRGTAPFCTRSSLDAAAMKLRTNEVVLGPALGGGTYFAGFREPIDFDEVLGDQELETMTRRAIETGSGVDFLPVSPQVETSAGLRTSLAMITARMDAGRVVPSHTAEVARGLNLTGSDEKPRTGTDSP